jgi:hypothetical protein
MQNSRGFSHQLKLRNITYPVAIAALLAACGGQSIRADEGDAEGGRSNGPSQGGRNQSSGATAGTGAGTPQVTGGNHSGAAPGGGAVSAAGSSVVGSGGSIPVAGTSAGTGKNGSAGKWGGPDLDFEPAEPPLCGGVHCQSSEICCVGTGRCFDPADDADSCPVPPPPEDEEDDRRPCASDAHCGANEYCRVRDGLCQGDGFCQSRAGCPGCAGTDCVVCGCDGNTYPNIQTACAFGANVVSPRGGGCGELVDHGEGNEDLERRACGRTSDCGPGELCCSITGYCYPGSEPDLCRVPPEGTTFPCLTDDQCLANQYCAGEGCSGPGGCRSYGSSNECGITLEPVCGCDGVSYTSAPCADMSGVRVLSDGQCTSAE